MWPTSPCGEKFPRYMVVVSGTPVSKDQRRYPWYGWLRLFENQTRSHFSSGKFIAFSPFSTLQQQPSVPRITEAENSVAKKKHRFPVTSFSTLGSDEKKKPPEVAAAAALALSVPGTMTVQKAYFCWRCRQQIIKRQIVDSCRHGKSHPAQG
eukprot:CAMPEP_0196664462 /NCGR_PEP_ID=MMETSP1086-20130531/57286_1 /TAXON_ID=77921 /ORGANISM="Cyanoptyche  gloeocystis , Strain SAG4.97" /LENGTH=151 /DNA_ID=CAMNT_0042000787 /DNA_START=18 /DNA_END=469 /DNA_ORIENTATION=-